MRWLALGFAVMATTAHADYRNCDPKDFRDISKIKLNQFQSIALLEAIDEKLYKQLQEKTKLSGSYPIAKGVIVGGDVSWDQFQQNASSYRKLYQFSSSSSTKEEIIQSFIDPLYSECLSKAPSVGTSVWVESGDPSDPEIVIGFRFTTAGGDQTRRRVAVDISSNAAVAAEDVQRLRRPEAGNKEDFIRIARSELDKATNIVVRVYPAGSNGSAPLRINARPRILFNNPLEKTIRGQLVYVQAQSPNPKETTACLNSETTADTISPDPAPLGIIVKTGGQNPKWDTPPKLVSLTKHQACFHGKLHGQSYDADGLWYPQATQITDPRWIDVTSTTSLSVLQKNSCNGTQCATPMKTFK